MFGPLLEVEILKSARRCGAKHISKSKCTKHLSVGPLLEVAMSKKCTPLWRKAHVEVKMYKAHHARTTFGSCDVEKVHAIVARSTCRSQNVQNTPCSDHWTTFGGSDVEKVHAVVARNTFPSQNVQNTTCSRHFWKFRCRKSARRCGAKHMSKWKCTKHWGFGPFLEVQMLKKCTPLWREAHFQLKMYKTLHVRATFGGLDSKKCTPLWREAHFKVKMYKTLGSRTIFEGSDAENVYAVVARSTLQSHTTLQSITLQYTPLHSITLHYATTTQLHSTTLHCTKLLCTTLHDTTLHSTTLHYTTLHYLPLHFATLHYTTTTTTTTLRYPPRH